MTMRTEEVIKKRLEVLEKDKRLTEYPVATVQINAPLALIQASAWAEANALRWVLGLKLRAYHGAD